MKIEIDLNNMFTDDDGNPTESIQESIKRQVVEVISKKIEAGITRQIDVEVEKQITTTLKNIADTLLPKLAEDMINAEYKTVDMWGSMTKSTTTFRAELVKLITSSMVYKKCNYKSDENAFTKTVDAVIEENIKKFQSEFNKIVTDEFRKDALAYAIDTLKKKLGV